VQKISTFGWIVFIIGLFFCLIGAFFSLLFKEEVRICPSCKGHIDEFRPVKLPRIASNGISRHKWDTKHIYLWAGIIAAVIILGAFFGTTRNYDAPNSSPNTPAIDSPTASPVPTSTPRIAKRKRKQDTGPQIIQRASPSPMEQGNNESTPLPKNKGNP
jgi:hypothetical protein